MRIHRVSELKDKYSDIAYMQNLKKIQVNLFTKQIHRLREPSYGHQGISEGDRLEIWD